MRNTKIYTRTPWRSCQNLNRAENRVFLAGYYQLVIMRGAASIAAVVQLAMLGDYRKTLMRKSSKFNNSGKITPAYLVVWER